MAGTPKSELPEGWRELATRGVKRDPLRNFDARAKVFLDRIAHLSADLDSHGHTRANALKKLRRICEAEARRLKASPHPGHRQVLPLKVPRRHPPNRPKPRGLAPQKNALRPALQLPCASPDAQIGAGATAYLILVTFMLPYLIVVLRRRRFWYIPPIDNGSRNRLRAFSVEPRLRALRRISGYHRKRNFFTTRSVSKFTHSIDARYKRHRFRAAVMFYRLHELWLVDSELRLEH